MNCLECCGVKKSVKLQSGSLKWAFLVIFNKKRHPKMRINWLMFIYYPEHFFPSKAREFFRLASARHDLRNHDLDLKITFFSPFFLLFPYFLPFSPCFARLYSHLATARCSMFGSGPSGLTNNKKSPTSLPFGPP